MGRLMSEFLPFALPMIGQEEMDEVANCLRSGWLTTGQRTKAFEASFADFVGCRRALAVNSATAGLHLALEACDVGPGDQVVTSPYTFTATAEVVRYLGADPVFIDIQPDSLNIDPQLVEVAVSELDRVRAIMPVHFAGQACDMDPIMATASRFGARVIEDAAHSFPTTYKNRMVGRLGDITVYSFYATKTITTGEGGMVATDDIACADRIETMRLHGISRDVFDRYSAETPSWHYDVVAPGFKYNMPDLAASIGIHQLAKAHHFRDRREWIAKEYTNAFGRLPVTTPFVANGDDMHAWHLYVLLLNLEDLAIDRNRFIELMAEAGIGTSVHFIPLHIQPYWRDRYAFAPEDFPVAMDTYRRAVSLPIYPKMTDQDVHRVIEAVTVILSVYSR
jgi:dTDP-4-amino-4,6-dideoxygalactose transaminase